MTIKENDGYWENGAWYPYEKLTWKLNDVVFENTEHTSTIPRKFTVEIKQRVTKEEMSKWMKIFEAGDLETHEVS